MIYRSESLPSRGAWIEISRFFVIDNLTQSLPSRGAWIEIFNLSALSDLALSLPSRGAWIEIYKYLLTYVNQLVAPFTGSVD